MVSGYLHKNKINAGADSIQKINKGRIDRGYKKESTYNPGGQDKNFLEGAGRW